MNREIVAILRGVMPNEILSIAEAIWEAGLILLRSWKKRMGQALVGAGKSAGGRGCIASVKPR